MTNTSGAITPSLPAPLAGDVVLSGVGGLSVSSVSPNTPFTINSGGTQTIIYILSGIPSGGGTLNADWNYGDLSCIKTNSVISGDANFTLLQTAFVFSVLDGSPVTDIQGIVDNSSNKKTISLAYTGSVGSYKAYTSGWMSSGSGMGHSGDSNNFRISYPGGTFGSSGNIIVTYEVDGDGVFNAKKELFGIQESIAILPMSVNGVNKGNFLLDVIGGIPDRRFGQNTIQDNIAGTYHNNVYLPITSIATGKVWSNNNLGADYSNMSKQSYDPSQQGTSSADYHSYCSLYQWGRYSDGHEWINWTSSTTGTPVNESTETLSGTNTPNNNLFITNGVVSPFDWRSPQINSLWNSVENVIINNPCPEGYRVPTNTELTTEVTMNNITNSETAYSSVHKLVVAGARRYNNGVFMDNGVNGFYWSANAFGSVSVVRLFNAFSNETGARRASGYPVRCIKN